MKRYRLYFAWGILFSAVCVPGVGFAVSPVPRDEDTGCAARQAPVNAQVVMRYIAQHPEILKQIQVQQCITGSPSQVAPQSVSATWRWQREQPACVLAVQ